MLQKLDPQTLRAHKGISFVGVTTTFLCHDGKGSFFMAKRSQNARDEQGNWDTGAGGLKWGQSAEENVRREVKEEYGADPLEVTFLGYDDVFRNLQDGTPTHWLALRFLVLVDRSQVSICEPDAHDEGDWFTVDNLPNPLHSQLIPFLEKYSKQIERYLVAK